MKNELRIYAITLWVYIETYLYNLGAAFSQLLNAALAGDRDVSLSGRTGEAYLKGKAWAVPVRLVLDGIFGHGHCIESIEPGLGRNSLQALIRRRLAERGL